jgi:hypothetical protein
VPELDTAPVLELVEESVLEPGEKAAELLDRNCSPQFPKRPEFGLVR